MRTLCAGWAAGLLLAAAVTGAGAAAPSQARPVGLLLLPTLLDSVWSYHPRVREAEGGLRAAGYEVVGSYGGFLPSISVVNSTGVGASSSIEGSLPLWRGGATFAQIKGSKAREVIAQGSLVRTRLALGEEALTAFYGMVQAQEQLLQWKSYLAALERLRSTIDNRARLGAAPAADLQTAVSRIRQAEVGQEAARLLLEASRSDLTRLLDFVPAVVQADGQLSTSLQALAQTVPSEAVEGHPDVKIAMAQVDEQVAKARLARSRLSPEVALQYRHYYDGEVLDPTQDEPQIVAQYQFGSAFSASAQFRSEQEKVAATEARLADVRRQVLSNLRLARERVASAGRQFELQRLAVENSQALVEGFLRQYQAGRRSWIEVLNAQREAHENDLGLIAARRGYLQGGQQFALQAMAWDLLLPASQSP